MTMVNKEQIKEHSGKFLYHTVCPKCGSKDNLAVYKNEDGSISGYCFTPGCGYYFHDEDGNYEEGITKEDIAHYRQDNNMLLNVAYRDLTKRNLKKSIGQKLDYGVSKDTEGNPVQVATYYHQVTNKPVAQKLRYADKTFRWYGDSHAPMKLFGQQAFSGNGKRIVITEGEIDALSVAQAFDGHWQVVSIPNGAQNAKHALLQQLEWLESFDEIVLGFDNDSAGKKAT
jgi:twinkle protein